MKAAYTLILSILLLFIGMVSTSCLVDSYKIHLGPHRYEIGDTLYSKTGDTVLVYQCIKNGCQNKQYFTKYKINGKN